MTALFQFPIPLYGVDLSKKVTPIMVREAMINCFVEARGIRADEGVRGFQVRGRIRGSKKATSKVSN